MNKVKNYFLLVLIISYLQILACSEEESTLQDIAEVNETEDYSDFSINIQKDKIEVFSSDSKDLISPGETDTAKDQSTENGNECTVTNNGVEICDGIDNDCNGIVDDIAAVNLPLCKLQEGVCKGAHHDLSKCKGKEGFLPCDELEYGEQYVPEEAGTDLCDGLDNDCDGKIDEFLNAPLCSNQNGVCKGSTKKCGSELGFIDCTEEDYMEYANSKLKNGYTSGSFQFEETICDFHDNDCDGETDENEICKPVAGWSSHRGDRMNTGNIYIIPELKEVMWAKELSVPLSFEPIVGSKGIFVVSRQAKYVYYLDFSGNFICSKYLDHFIEGVGVAINDDSIYIKADGIYSINNQCELKWYSKLPTTKSLRTVNLNVDSNGKIYVPLGFSEDKEFYVLNPDGSLHCKIPGMLSETYSSALNSDETVLVIHTFVCTKPDTICTEDNVSKIVAVNTENCEILWEKTFDDLWFVSAPAIDKSGYVYSVTAKAFNEKKNILVVHDLSGNEVDKVEFDVSDYNTIPTPRIYAGDEKTDYVFFTANKIIYRYEFGEGLIQKELDSKLSAPLASILPNYGIVVATSKGDICNLDFDLNIKKCFNITDPEKPQPFLASMGKIEPYTIFVIYGTKLFSVR